MGERVVADRLLLVDVVDCCFRLREPTFVQAGQAYWMERETSELCVDRGDGRITRHAGAWQH